MIAQTVGFSVGTYVILHYCSLRRYVHLHRYLYEQNTKSIVINHHSPIIQRKFMSSLTTWMIFITHYLIHHFFFTHNPLHNIFITHNPLHNIFITHNPLHNISITKYLIHALFTTYCLIYHIFITHYLILHIFSSPFT